MTFCNSLQQPDFAMAAASSSSSSSLNGASAGTAMAASPHLPPPPHAVILPWPVQGHINPMMQLALRLASSGFTITFVHSHRNLSLLKPKSDPLHLDFRFASISDGVPEEQKNRPADAQLFATRGHLETGFNKLLEKLSQENPPISCIISDTFLPWTQDSANKYGIPRVDFWTSSATIFLLLLYLPVIVSKGHIPVKGKKDANEEEELAITGIPGIPPMSRKDFPKVLLVEDISVPGFQFIMDTFKRVREAACVLVHTFYELETPVIEGLRAEHLSMYPVGPLLPSTVTKPEVSQCRMPTSLLQEDDHCLLWLQNQAPCSVLYVSFGSMFALSTVEAQGLARGLEASQQRFIWVVRSDSVDGSIADILPEGFSDRTKDTGLIISWAPQLSVLSHPSVGGFFTHCGWNSTLESLYFGVPMLGWPKDADQDFNCKLMAEKWQVGMMLKVDQEGVAIHKEVEVSVRAVMVGEEGKEARRRAADLRDTARRAVAAGGSSISNLQAFVDHIKEMS